MRYVIRLIAIVHSALVALQIGPANAEKRLALLLGNQAYTSEIGPLANPHNDVALLEKALERLGFEVASVRDAGLADMHQAINAYVRRTREAGSNAVGFLYYAGHGASDSGINYLIPVDVKSAEEGDLWDRSLRVAEITRKLKTEAGNATHFVVLDACRNTLKLRKAGSRAHVQSRGLVRLTEEAGMLIAYATAEGELASDVGVGAGPYAKVLAEEIVKPGVEAVTMFRNVQRRVRAAIRQEPHLQFSALGDVYLAGPAPLPPTSDAELWKEAERAWATIKDSGSIAELEVILKRYDRPPVSVFADLARARIEELKKKQAALATQPPSAEPPKLVVPPKLVEPVAISPSRAPAPLTATEERALKPKDSFKECGDCPEMVVVAAGSFTMGSSAEEIAALKKESNNNWYENEGPQHRVTIARPFAVGKFEVTFAEWDACVAARGCTYRPDDAGWGRKNRPVINLSWNDITKQYLPWISRKTGKMYRLLTEAEWEYAARGVTSALSPGRRYWWGDQASKEYVNYGNDDCCVGLVGRNWPYTSPVGQFPANPFGLHDMHGNVWEWVQDCWNGAYIGAPSDGSAWTTGDCSRRVLRSGSWNYRPSVLRSAIRNSDTPDYRYTYFGFRVGRTL